MTVNPIVAAIDGSAEALRAVGWAVSEAVLRDAPLRIVSATELPPRMAPRKDTHGGPSTVAEVVTAERDRALTEAAERATAIDPDLLVSTDALPGSVAQAVTDSGAGASMLVVGSRGAGAFAAMILGSVSRYAATHAACPVVVVRDDSTASRQGQVVVGVRDADSDATLTFAFEEAALHNASLLAVHAWQARDPDLVPNEGPAPGSDPGQAGAARKLESLLDGWREKYPGVAVSQEVVHGHPGRALAGLSARAGLVVLGRHYPHRGPGRVIHAVLNHAHCPVATVPSPRTE
jgi:nucleotide-binding universal stress UspA family protein